MSSVDAKKRVFDLLNGSFAATGYYGLSDLAANTDALISQIYIAPTYSDADRVQLAALFANTPINVLGEFPRDSKSVPSITILRASDTEQPGAPIGDYLGQDDDGLNDIYGTRFNEAIEVHVWGNGRGARMLRDVLYLAVRELVIRGRKYLISAGMISPTWRNGKDGQMQRPEYGPEIVHAGYAQITYGAEMSWPESKAGQPKTYEQNITGINGGQVSVSAYLSEE